MIDRYYYSGIVYSAAKGRHDLSLRWARDPEVGLPRPDLCLFLDIGAEAAAGRGGFGNEKYETSAMQDRVRNLFYELLELPDGGDMEIIDANRDAPEVEKEIMDRIKESINDETLAKGLRIVLPWDEMAYARSSHLAPYE